MRDVDITVTYREEVMTPYTADRELMRAMLLRDARLPPRVRSDEPPKRYLVTISWGSHIIYQCTTNSDLQALHCYQIRQHTAFRRRQLRLQYAFHSITVRLQSYNIRKVNRYNDKNGDNELKEIINTGGTAHVYREEMTLPAQQRFTFSTST